MIDLLVLGGNKETGYRDELEVGAFNLLFRKVPIDEVDGEVERLRDQLELEVDLDEPVDEDTVKSRRWGMATCLERRACSPGARRGGDFAWGAAVRNRAWPRRAVRS